PAGRSAASRAAAPPARPVPRAPKRPELEPACLASARIVAPRPLPLTSTACRPQLGRPTCVESSKSSLLRKHARASFLARIRDSECDTRKSIFPAKQIHGEDEFIMATILMLSDRRGRGQIAGGPPFPP